MPIMLAQNVRQVSKKYEKMTLMSYKKKQKMHTIRYHYMKKNSNQFRENDTQSSSNNENVIYRSCLLYRCENVNYDSPRLLA